MPIEGRNLLWNLGPMKVPSKWRNIKKYCKFHKDMGYDTTEYFLLRDQI